jgi:prepilin-type N-terminal cleavage/methylation domain-containing protein
MTGEGVHVMRGFTLAEVLITLGIIGVVAALTIPGLIADYQEKSWASAQTVFMSRMQEATRMMNVNESLAGYATTEAFADELVKNLKTIKVCKTNPQECFTSQVTNAAGTETVEASNLRTARDFGREDYNTNIVGLILANGYSALLAYDPDCKAMDPAAAGAQTIVCISMVYDINGKGRPNKVTKDIYTQGADGMFNTCGGVKIGSLCAASAKTPYAPLNTCAGSADREWDPTDHSNCSSNYWAGAIKACDSLGMRLPTRAELLNMCNAGIFTLGKNIWSSEPSFPPEDVYYLYVNSACNFISDAHYYGKGNYINGEAWCVK